MIRAHVVALTSLLRRPFRARPPPTLTAVAKRARLRETGPGAPALGENVPAEPAIRPVRGLPLRPRGWSALGSYNYRLYFFGQLVSQTGSWMQRIAQSWLVLDLTGSPAALGLVTVFQFLPITVLTLFAGVVVDRLPKHRLLIAIQVAGCIQAAALALLVLGGHIQLWQVYLLAFALGTISAFDLPARQSMASELVGREALQSAISLNSSVFNAARILGPGIGGVIVATWGVGWAFMLNAVSYVGVVGALLLMRRHQLFPSRRPARAAIWTQLADGLRYALRTPDLTFTLSLLAVVGILAYNFGVGLPLLARYGLDVGSVGFGAMNAAMGLGSLVGAVAVAGLIAPTRRNLLLTGGVVSATLLFVGLTPWYPVTLAFLVVLGLGSVLYSTTTNTILQLTSKEEYRGRVLSLYTLLFAGTAPLGGAVTGWLADARGIQATLALEGGVCLAAVTLSAILLIRYRAAHPTLVASADD